MIQTNKTFVSYIESRIEPNNELYARFHLGSFAAGQSLTIANALRRTLLSEIPAFIITKVNIEGVRHEFDSINDIQENILDVILNIKNISLTSQKLNTGKDFVQNKEFKAYINFSGPGQITANDIEFPADICPVFGNQYIATCTNTGIFKATLTIKFIDPIEIVFQNQKETSLNQYELVLHSIPKPIRQVNYTIQKTSINPNTEYISFEVWTDGSIYPDKALELALEKLTTIFYSFTNLSKQLDKSIYPDNRFIQKINN
jgi:DNA-directed RNA polymerase subunit alpha